MSDARGRTYLELQWVVLDSRVLMVDVRSGSNRYDTYIGVVEGKNYGEEAIEVIANGSPVSGHIAEVFFEPVRSRVRTLFGRDRLSDDSSRVVPQTPLSCGILGTNYLDEHVAVVAKGYPDDTWSAFIGAVEGKDYGKEADEVVANGSKIPFELAEICFNDLGKVTEVKGDKWHIKP